ncbi:hypothetical protein [Paraburkholderia fynbosensis]|uniref:hypothetical protein n=1 Tax=Paraburkholderia fynbosensis TaxID=1200993 RepID=UPI0015825A48|nr:hypothetical protein [Paraburkholderia fynbosensis]
MCQVENPNAAANRTKQGSGKTRANGLTKGLWPILTNRYSLKPTLNALRICVRQRTKQMDLTDNQARTTDIICSQENSLTAE